MLAAETSVRKYPLEAVRFMARTATEADPSVTKRSSIRRAARRDRVSPCGITRPSTTPPGCTRTIQSDIKALR